MTTLPNDQVQAARLLAGHWAAREHLEALPLPCRPAHRADGYAIQALWPSDSVGQVGGWKIAATSEAGQKHIAVSGPLAGPVFARRVLRDGATVSLAGNRMRVAECEVVFIFGQPMHPREQPYTLPEILPAVASLSPGIEVPDSRFMQFDAAGEAQLIADCACSNAMVLGTPILPDQRIHSLLDLQVQAQLSDGRSLRGIGRNVLGDPLLALVWFVNEIGAAGQSIQAGQFLTTGACVTPISVEPGDSLEVDFDWLGQMRVAFS